MPDINQHPAEPTDAMSPDAIQPAAQPPTQSDTTPSPMPDTGQPQGVATEHEHELTQLQQRLEELQDQNLRAQAEVQNTRRRADEEVAKARKFAIEAFAENLLPVLDSLEAALNVQNATAEQLREGTVATHRQLLSVLERNKVVAINPAAGDKFDPTQQHAISTVAADGQAPGTVVEVLQKGYLLAERVLRPALVTVAQTQ